MLQAPPPTPSFPPCCCPRPQLGPQSPPSSVHAYSAAPCVAPTSSAPAGPWSPRPPPDASCGWRAYAERIRTQTHEPWGPVEPGQWGRASGAAASHTSQGAGPVPGGRPPLPSVRHKGPFAAAQAPLGRLRADWCGERRAAHAPAVETLRSAPHTRRCGLVQRSARNAGRAAGRDRVGPRSGRG